MRWKLFMSVLTVGLLLSASMIFSEQSLGKGKPTPPEAPSGFDHSDQTTMTITWTWIDNSDNEKEFEVHDDTHAVVVSVEADVTEATETGLSENTQYTRHVAAVNKAGSSESDSATAYTAVHDATTGEAGTTWTEATSEAEWAPRIGHRAISFDSKLWVMGGIVGGSYANDVWSSMDGQNWNLVTSAADWAPRHKFGLLAYDDGSGMKLWVLGGGQAEYNDVWCSSDGQNWNLVTSAAHWPGRKTHGHAVFDNGDGNGLRMWIMGGKRDGVPRNDVWWSKDGINWVEATPHAGWNGKSGVGTVVHDDKLWAMGGDEGSGGTNNVWNSPDGINWMEVNPAADWYARDNFFPQALDGKLWVFGGLSDIGRLNDVWTSPDGVSWEELPAADWKKRSPITSTVHDDTIWVLGGRVEKKGKDPQRNDVWRLDMLLGDFTLSQVGGLTVEISVTPPPNGFSGLTGVRIQRAEDSGFTVNLVTVAEFGQVYTIDDTVPEAKTYWYRIQFRNGDGDESSYSGGLSIIVVQ